MYHNFIAEFPNQIILVDLSMNTICAKVKTWITYPYWGMVASPLLTRFTKTLFWNMDDRKALIHVYSHCFSVPIVDG